MYKILVLISLLLISCVFVSAQETGTDTDEGKTILARTKFNGLEFRASRVGMTTNEQKHSTAEPTGTHIRNIEIELEEFAPLHNRVRNVIEIDMEAQREKLVKVVAPYTPGTLPELTDY